jgi:hypothetical protein
VLPDILRNRSAIVSLAIVFGTIGIGISAVFFRVSIFLKNSQFVGYDMTQKGALGDAVNGLSAPVISFFAAILIFIIFRAQTGSTKPE